LAFVTNIPLVLTAILVEKNAVTEGGHANSGIGPSFGPCSPQQQNGWTGHKSSSGFSDRPREPLGEFLRLWTGFELPSSWSNLPCYGVNRKRNILDFMRWSDFGLGAQDLNGIQRPNSFQKNSWK
jgi:hypothetical protein